MSDIYRLVYASKNLLAENETDLASAVSQILKTSQRNNAAAGVSGALLFNKGAFAQVLEGPRRTVEDTFERIQRDPRHGDVTVLQCGPAASRGFANWSMAFVGHSLRGQALWNDLGAASGFDLARLDGDAVFSMLHGLVLDEEGFIANATETVPAHAPTGLVDALDVEQVRVELVDLRPDLAPTIAGIAKEVAATGDARSGDVVDQRWRALDAALAEVKSSSADLHRQTRGFREQIDSYHIKLAVCRQEIAALRQERDKWAERAHHLALAMCEEAQVFLPANQTVAARQAPEALTAVSSKRSQAAA